LDGGGINLIKSIAVTGVIILLAGLMLMPVSSTPKTVNDYINIRVVGQAASPQSLPSWNISQTFGQNEIVGFDFRVDADWSDNAYDLYTTNANLTGQQYPARYLNIEVTDPQSESTTFEIILCITSMAGGAGAVSVLADYYKVYNSTSSTFNLIDPAQGYNGSTGGLAIEKGYPCTVQLPTTVNAWGGGTIYQLGKTTMQGLYTITLSLDPSDIVEPGSLPTQASPPADLVMVETRIGTQYPYSWLLPAGASIGIIGVAIMIPGVISKKRKPLHKA
jgi:hypothetical protein